MGCCGHVPMVVGFLTTCLSPLTLWVGSLIMRGVLDTTLCVKICQRLATSQWFSPVSSTNKTDGHGITEILLKVALNTINLKPKPIKWILSKSNPE
jgi:hypothetical protein